MDKRINIAVAFSGINDEYQGKMCVGISRKLKNLKNVTVAYFSAFNADIGLKEVEDAENEIFSLINFDVFDALIVIPNNFLRCMDVLLALVKRANESGTPVFAMDVACEGCKNILINNVPAYKRLVDHLIDVHGLKDLMYVGGVKDKPYCSEKLTQFKKSLADHGMEFDIDRCLWGEFYDGAAKRELAKYLDNGGKLPEAFVCANDSMALGICYELESRGYTVPEDVYVTGFDGIITNLLHQPAITTVEVPYQELGGKTLEAVLDYLQNPGDDNDVEKKYTIVSDPSFFGSCECVSDERTIRNRISKNLSVDLYRRNYMNSYFVKMSAELSTCEDIESYFKTLEHYVNEMQTKSIYLCYSLEYTLSYERYDSFLENYSVPSKAQLSDDICAKIIYKNGKICEPEVFKKQEMLPDMFANGDDSREYYFVPIHFLSRTFGYVACEVRGDLESGNSAMYNSWVSYIAISHNNVLEQIKAKRYTDVLEDLYNRDSLTMLFNRRGLLTEQAGKIDYITRNNLPVMLFLLDLDDMKGINDGFGHAAGDEALLLIAESLNEVKGEQDIVCRYGGDEFLLFGIGYDEAAAEQFGKRLEKEISRRGEENQVKYNLSASFGYAICKNYTAEYLDELCSEADTNMYIHKRSKKANA